MSVEITKDQNHSHLNLTAETVEQAKRAARISIAVAQLEIVRLALQTGSDSLFKSMRPARWSSETATSIPVNRRYEIQIDNTFYDSDEGAFTIHPREHAWGEQRQVSVWKGGSMSVVFESTLGDCERYSATPQEMIEGDTALDHNYMQMASAAYDFVNRRILDKR